MQAGLLGELLERLGLGESELQERLDFLSWGPEDQARLSLAKPQAEPLNRAFVEALYNRLSEFSVPAAILADRQTVQRLKARQHAYYQTLFDGCIDESYVRERLQIGQVHERVGVDLKWYMGGYRLYLSSLLHGMLGPVEQQALETYDSLLKVVFLDMTLAAEAYIAAKHGALQASEARFAHALRGANDGIWDWDLDSDELYVSDRWANMLGYTPLQVGTTSAAWFALVHPEDVSGLEDAIDQHLTGRTPTIMHEYRILRSEGEYLRVLLRGVLETVAGRRRLAGSQTDISERFQVQAQLEYAARHDALTGLINRVQLNQVLQDTEQRLKREGARCAALLFIDLDRFKLINDSLGHAAGDNVLVHVARRLQGYLRPGDHLARFGGDEFIMLLDDLARPEDAEVVAARVLARLREPLQFGERCLIVSASIGVAQLRPGVALADSLQAADMALYSAKEAGKARYRLYSDDMQARVRQRLRLESNLLQALQYGQFELHYQPVLDMRLPQPSAPVAVEALLRWQYEGQSIAPIEFIPILEESGEIVPVGYWVLETACRQSVSWHAHGRPDLLCSVNLSGLQLLEVDFVERVREILQRTGMPPTLLVLEITESLLIDRSGATLVALRELAAMGIQIALDDFGTGYCSLGYLNRFPLHIIKLDRGFLQNAHASEQNMTICKAIIGLSAGLKLKVIAEGIERPEQVQLLLQENCHYGQGYLFSRPLPANELSALIGK